MSTEHLCEQKSERFSTQGTRTEALPGKVSTDIYSSETQGCNHKSSFPKFESLTSPLLYAVRDEKALAQHSPVRSNSWESGKSAPVSCYSRHTQYILGYSKIESLTNPLLHAVKDAKALAHTALHAVVGGTGKEAPSIVYSRHMHKYIQSCDCL